MEILHKKIFFPPSISIEKFLDYYTFLIDEKKVCTNYHPVLEVFSEDVWNTICIPNSSSENYKFSPGKMQKNFVKLYFWEMPLDYIILELDKDYVKSSLETEVELLEKLQLRAEIVKRMLETNK